MENLNLAKKLNNHIESLLKDDVNGKNTFSMPTFYLGEGENTISKVVSTIAPYGKVAVVYTKNGFTEYSKNLTTAIKKIGAKPINFIMPDLELESGCFSLENLYELFYFPEDVRAVITIETCLIPEISYYASVLNIPAVYCINNCEQENLLPYRVYVKNLNEVDEVIITCKRHIIIDNKQIIDNVDNGANLFAFILSKICCLVDFNFNALINGDLSKYIEYNSVLKALKESYSIINQPLTERNEILLYNLLIINLANCCYGGSLLDYSSLYSASRLLKNNNAYTLINLCKKILSIYQVYLSNEYNQTTFFPVYNKRAESLSFATGEKAFKFIENYQTQLEKIKNIKDLEGIIKNVYQMVNQVIVDFDNIFSTYFALNGKVDKVDSLDINVALKYSGDLSQNLNLMSLVRESGITELF